MFYTTLFWDVLRSHMTSDKLGSLPFGLKKNKLQSHLWSSQMFWGFLGRIPPTTASTPWWVDPPPSSCRFAPRTHNAQAWRGGAHAPCPGALVPGDIGWMDVNYVFHVKRVELLYKYVSASTGSVLLEEWHTDTHTHQEKVQAMTPIILYLKMRLQFQGKMRTWNLLLASNMFCQTALLRN